MKIIIHMNNRKKYQHDVTEEQWLQIQKEMMDDEVRLLLICEHSKDFHYNKLYICAVEAVNED